MDMRSLSIHKTRQAKEDELSFAMFVLSLFSACFCDTSDQSCMSFLISFIGTLVKYGIV